MHCTFRLESTGPAVDVVDWLDVEPVCDVDVESKQPPCAFESLEIANESRAT